MLSQDVHVLCSVDIYMTSTVMLRMRKEWASEASSLLVIILLCQLSVQRAEPCSYGCLGWSAVHVLNNYRCILLSKDNQFSLPLKRGTNKLDHLTFVTWPPAFISLPLIYTFLTNDLKVCQMAYGWMAIQVYSIRPPHSYQLWSGWGTWLWLR